MQNKAKIIAISGVCGALSTVCLMLCSLPATRWLILVLAVFASVAVAIPTMVSGKVLYSVLTYLASSVIGVFVGLQNILYVAPIVATLMPMAIIKVSAETLKISTKVEKQTINSPFDNGDDKQVVAMQIDAKPRMKQFAKWLLYYVVLEVGIVLTLLASYLFMRPTFDLLWANKLLVWVIVAFQALPIPYDLLLRSCFTLTAKTLKRHIK